MYIKLHENLWTEDTLKDIKKYLPLRVTNRGRPPSLATENLETRFRWNYRPDEDVYSKKVKSKLMGLAMECAVIFFFENFSYTFGGKVFLQDGGGPIGARLTMAIARLVMQEWKENYSKILENSKIEEFLSGIYVDDGRTLHRKLYFGERFDSENSKFSWNKETEENDIKSGMLFYQGNFKV